ncbi:hypothetical protein H2248_010695 [Termitomyces sp. 'cryptogamus']|nr:hypothetical protein H2248_010695 [Termitomyces sp. 'cryptogamus']
MSVVDRKPQLQLTLNDPVLEKADTMSVYEDVEDKHGYLLKDIPYDENGDPYLDIAGGYQQMEIRVGTPLWKKYANLIAALREQTNLVGSNPDPNRKYKIIGGFNGYHWPLGLGFRRLGEFLLFLGNNEIGYRRWESLTILLPDIELPYDGPSLPILPLDAFANLQHLTWKGHRKQLLVSWLPLVPSLLRTLITLEIQCDIALQDCCYLLYHGRNLKKVTLKIIQKDLAHDQVLGFIAPPVCASRPLEDLCLVSDDDIGPLLRPFIFPSLRRICFTLGYPIWSTFPDLTIWKTLQKIKIKGNFPNEDCNWIRSQCSPTTQFNFDRHGIQVKYASSFLHKDSPFYRW